MGQPFDFLKFYLICKMMSRIHSFFKPFCSIFLVIFFLVSCTKEDVVPDLSLSSQKVSASAGTVDVKVQASGRWALALYCQDGGEDWATISKTSGRGSDASVILRYSENLLEESRSASVVLTVAGKDYIRTFVQLGKNEIIGPAVHPKWLELPAVEEDEDCRFYSHDMSLASGARCRNYSFLWDRSHLVAHWVAYPLNSSLIGNGSRTDEWDYDPLVPREDQPVLFGGYRGGYDRGHQLPSADRLQREANEQTFYFTNMTPQLGSKFNQSIWANFEGKVRDWARSADTLYVVTGCVLDHTLGVAYDNNGRAVTVPGGYFKALLRYQKSSSIGYGGYAAAGFYLEHENYSSNTMTDDMCMSIDALEEITGLDFFVNLKEKLPTLSDKIEAQDPLTLGIWKTN